MPIIFCRFFFYNICRRWGRRAIGSVLYLIENGIDQVVPHTLKIEFLAHKWAFTDQIL
jgi:hypothetical protein